MECSNCYREHEAADVCMLAALMGVLENRLERKLTSSETEAIYKGYDDDDMWDRHLGPAVDVIEALAGAAA